MNEWLSNQIYEKNWLGVQLHSNFTTTLGHRSDDDSGGDTFINLSANGDKFNEYEMI